MLTRRALLVAPGVALAFAGAPTPPSRADHDPATAPVAAAKRCMPLGGLLVRQTIRRGLRNGGNEVTERLADGVYRVTRCDRAGALTSSMTVEPVQDPDGRRVLAPEAIVRGHRLLMLDYGDPRDPRWARMWRRARARVAASVIAATRASARPDSAFDRRNVTGSSVRAAEAAAFAGPSAKAAGSSCDAGGYLKSGEIWPGHRYGWRWRASTFGSNGDILRAMELGAQAWDVTKNSCDFGDITTITPVYEGATDLAAGAQDNANTVDKGSVASFGCEGALACTQVWYSATGAVEADIRFSDQVRWSTGGASGSYDYRAVATHEFGHFIGLSDLHDSPNLTMYYATHAGSTDPRTLGRGDVLGLRALYP